MTTAVNSRAGVVELKKIASRTTTTTMMEEGPSVVQVVGACVGGRVVDGATKELELPMRMELGAAV